MLKQVVNRERPTVATAFRAVAAAFTASTRSIPATVAAALASTGSAIAEFPANLLRQYAHDLPAILVFHVADSVK